MSSVFVVDACRTPIGKVKGSLAEVRPDDLAAGVLKALLDRIPAVDPAAIDDVYWGAANQAGEDNRNVARMAVLLAGLPDEVPGATVNRLCGSGMEAVADAARAIAAGDADICVAGGTESMTRAPFVIARTADPYPRSLDLADTRLGWRLVSPKMQEMYPPVTLGETAENVADKYGITRERQDECALRSHHRAAAARDAGRFAQRGRPGHHQQGRGHRRRGHQADITLEELAAKKPAFRKGGTVTGGNSSPLNDGAAALLLDVRGGRDRAGLTPLARYAGAAAAGVHPDFMGIGPVPAMNRALARVGWRLGTWSSPSSTRRSPPSRSPASTAQARPGDGQRERRRHRDRPPARLLRRPDRHHAAARDAPPRRCGAPPRCASASARASRPSGKLRDGHFDKFRYPVDNRCITALCLAAQTPGRAEVGSVTLIEGGFGNRASDARRRTRRRRTARAAAPLLIPIALALTLGVILAVSSGTPTAHVNQQTTSGTVTSTPRP